MQTVSRNGHLSNGKTNGRHATALRIRREWTIADAPEELQQALADLAAYLAIEGYSAPSIGAICRHVATEGTLEGLVEGFLLEPADYAAAEEVYVAGLPAAEAEAWGNAVGEESMFRPIDDSWFPADTVRITPPEIEDEPAGPGPIDAAYEAQCDRVLAEMQAMDPVYPPLTLVEEIQHEVLGYQSMDTPLGDFLAAQLDRLAQLVKLTSARTGAEFADRFEILEADARDQWYRDGYEAGRATR